VSVMGKTGQFDIRPYFVIMEGSPGVIPAYNPDLGIRMKFENIDPQTGTFILSSQITDRDWVIMKAVEMPYINILWIGTIIMAIGIGIASWRRCGEFRKMENKQDLRKPRAREMV
jgi:cytochrome c-type biogenesis protein CcmF